MGDRADPGNVLSLPGLWCIEPHGVSINPSNVAKQHAAHMVMSLLAQPIVTSPAVLTV